MIKRLKNLSTYFYFLVYNYTSYKKRLPPHLLLKPCLLCLARTHHSHGLCPSCEKDLPYNTLKCKQCALPLPSNQQRCGECISEPPPFERTISPFIYRFPIDRFIQHIKYGGKRFYINCLVEFIVQSVNVDYSDSAKPDLLISVPLHSKKQRLRGFNQSEKMAKEISKRTRIPFTSTLVSKLKETDSQASLNKHQRKQNLKGAFQIKPHQHAHIAIIDDVMTTKATAEVLAKALLASGAKRVDIWCAARTPKKN